MTLNINIENRNVIKILTLVTVFVVGMFAVARMYDALLMVLIAFFVALALNPAVSFLAKYMPGKRRGPAIAIVFIATISLFGFLFASIIPPIVNETSNFAKTLPDQVNESFFENDTIQGVIERYDLQETINNTVATSKERAAGIGVEVLSGASRAGAGVLTTLTILVVAVLMLTGGGRFLNRLADISYRDQALRERHEQLAQKMYRAVTGYVVGQFSLAFAAALFALGALMLLGIPYPVPLAGIVFIFGLIPLIGNTIAAVIVVLTTIILKDFTAGLILLAFFIVYQQLENITLQPFVQGKTTNLPPLIIFVSVIFGVALIGPIGGLMAIPAAGVAKVLYLDYLEHRQDATDEDSPKTMVQKVKHHVSKKLSA